MLNRIYVVCDAGTSFENLVMKSNFDLMRKQISSYMKYVNKYGFNELLINDNGNEYHLKSDIIVLSTNN